MTDTTPKVWFVTGGNRGIGADTVKAHCRRPPCRCHRPEAGNHRGRTSGHLGVVWRLPLDITDEEQAQDAGVDAASPVRPDRRAGQQRRLRPARPVRGNLPGPDQAAVRDQHLRHDER